MTKTIAFLGALAVLIVVGLSSIFIVDERESGLVLQFGQIKQVKTEAGLGVKLPFIQNVQRYDMRIQALDTESLEVTPLDDRRLVVDAFLRWRITDVVRFRQAVGTGGILQAESRLDQILRTNLREVLGSVNSNDVLSLDRVELMNRIRDAAAAEAQSLGIRVVDVRMKRTDLPQSNLEATFERMRAEREREARDERARGQEAAQRVRAQADRSAVELVSEAQREAEIIRGQADATRNAVFAEAYGKDPEFFAFYRSLGAYETALRGDNSMFVMTPDSEFFEYLRSDSGRRGSFSPSDAAEAAAAEARRNRSGEQGERQVPDPTEARDVDQLLDELESDADRRMEELGVEGAGDADGTSADGDSDAPAGDEGGSQDGATQDEASEPAE